MGRICNFINKTKCEKSFLHVCILDQPCISNCYTQYLTAIQYTKVLCMCISSSTFEKWYRYLEDMGRNSYTSNHLTN